MNMHYAFQDRENLYMVLDLMTGGDLRFLIGKRKRLPELQTSKIQSDIITNAEFVIACLIHGLEYMHTKGVVHRDIKPENLVVDADNYVRITDLGIARLVSPDNSQETSGTPGYMGTHPDIIASCVAPEVMCRQNHGVAVDYFALGVIAYEFMMGRRPYTGKTRKDIRDAILAKQVQLKRSDIPAGWSLEAADFINKVGWIVNHSIVSAEEAA